MIVTDQTASMPEQKAAGDGPIRVSNSTTVAGLRYRRSATSISIS